MDRDTEAAEGFLLYSVCCGSKEAGCICFTKGVQVRVIVEGFYHPACDVKSINKQIPRAPHFTYVFSFARSIYPYACYPALTSHFSSHFRVQHLEWVGHVVHKTQEPLIIHLQGRETASLCSARSSQLQCVAPPAGSSAHCSLPPLPLHNPIQLTGWQTGLGLNAE